MKSVKLPDRKTLEIAAHLRSDDALRRILLRELEIMVFNGACIVRQYDIECLHDFRVAMRRTCILLARSRGIFPRRVITRFKSGFVRLGRLTGTCRDLDVLLVHWPEMVSVSDEATRQVYDFLLSQRDRLRASLITELTRTKHKQFIKNWREFLTSESVMYRMPVAKQPVAATATEMADKMLHKVVRKLKKIHSGSSDCKIHKLRIACKRLRYMLDYFQGFSTKSGYPKLIGQLKTMQDELGRYQDLIIQRSIIMSIEQSMTASGLMSPDVNHAVRAIENVLTKRVRQQRKNVLAVMNKFLSKISG